MASADGRKLRVVAGLTLAGVSLIKPKKPNWALLGASMVPLSAGLFDWCVLGPLAGESFSGEVIRRKLG